MQPLKREPPLTRAAAALRRDPAPSRVQYRLQRLLLTPLYRHALQVGLPAFALAMVLGIYLSDDARRQALVADYQGAVKSVQDRPEFLVTLLAVDGASAPLADAVRQVAGVDLPVSSFALDLPAMRARIEAIEAVRSAELRVRSGGVLQIQVTERAPSVVWRAPGGLFLLDDQGHRIAGLTAREARADLPLIAGEGAERAVPEALALIAAAEPIKGRLRGLMRQGERRWDLVLDRDQRILLPQDDPVMALERIVALDEAEDILERDLVVVDMRNARRPTLRLSETALALMRGEAPPARAEARINAAAMAGN